MRNSQLTKSTAVTSTDILRICTGITMNSTTSTVAQALFASLGKLVSLHSLELLRRMIVYCSVEVEYGERGVWHYTTSHLLRTTARAWFCKIRSSLHTSETRFSVVHNLLSMVGVSCQIWQSNSTTPFSLYFVWTTVGRFGQGISSSNLHDIRDFPLLQLCCQLPSHNSPFPFDPHPSFCYTKWQKERHYSLEQWKDDSQPQGPFRHCRRRERLHFYIVWYFHKIQESFDPPFLQILSWTSFWVDKPASPNTISFLLSRITVCTTSSDQSLKTFDMIFVERS